MLFSDLRPSPTGSQAGSLLLSQRWGVVQMEPAPRRPRGRAGEGQATRFLRQLSFVPRQAIRALQAGQPHLANCSAAESLALTSSWAGLRAPSSSGACPRSAGSRTDPKPRSGSYRRPTCRLWPPCRTSPFGRFKRQAPRARPIRGSHWRECSGFGDSDAGLSSCVHGK